MHCEKVELIYSGSIGLSGNGSAEEEKGRRCRLLQVLEYVQCLSDRSGDNNTLSKVKSLHDHKGELTVTWCAEPEGPEKEFFSTAWKSPIGDGSMDVKHELYEEVFMPI